MTDETDETVPETPGYKLWAAMNDAETYEPELSEIDIWEYAANTFLESFKDVPSMPVKHIEDAYEQAFMDFEAHPSSVVRFGRMDALAAVLMAAKNGTPVVLTPAGNEP